MSLFSTSATLRPSHCLLVRRASGPMLLTGIPHLMSVARQSRHFGRTPANRRSREPALVTHSEGVAPTLQPDLALAGWWASPYLSWKGTSPREMHWTRSLQRGCSPPKLADPGWSGLGVWRATRNRGALTSMPGSSADAEWGLVPKS